MILLDSNVLSALMLDLPDLKVAAWLDRQPRTSVWTTSITIFEIRFGLSVMPAGKRRDQRLANFERILSELIEQRVLPFDTNAAEHTAQLAAARQRAGKPGELRDTMIAGIVLANHAQLATRNLKHFEDIASSLLNPWQD